MNTRGKQAQKIIEHLANKYRGDIEAQEEIQRAAEAIAFYEKQGEPEKAYNHALALIDFLHDWY